MSFSCRIQSGLFGLSLLMTRKTPKSCSSCQLRTETFDFNVPVTLESRSLSLDLKRDYAKVVLKHQF